jgi:hypothetical protein
MGSLLLLIIILIIILAKALKIVRAESPCSSNDNYLLLSVISLLTKISILR